MTSVQFQPALMLARPTRNHAPSPAAAALCAGSFAVPVTATLLVPPGWSELAGAVWLVVLVPVAVLARLYGWRGAAAALAASMALLVVFHLGASSFGPSASARLSWVIPLLLLLGAAIAWAEARRGERPGASHSTHDTSRELDLAFEAARGGQALALVVFELDEAATPAGDPAPLPEEYRALVKVLRDIVGGAASESSPHAPPRGIFALVRGADQAAAGAFAERVRRAFEASIPPGRPAVSVSAGVAEHRAAMESPDDLVAAAHLALQRAREGGPGSIRVFGRPASHPPAGGAASHPRAGRATPTAAPTPPAGQGNEAVREVDPMEADAGDGSTAGRAEPRIGLRGEGRRVLLVDDETPLRTLVATSLQKLGFSVQEGSDPLQGVRALAREFDAVITDLPPEDRPEVNLVTATKARWPETPVIAITGFGDARLAAEALRSGADRYLFKPFGIGELEGHLAELLAARDAALARRRTDPGGSRRTAGSAGAGTALLDGVRALARAVEIRDPFTRGHADRVRDYAAVLLDAMEEAGRRTGIDRDRLRLACELHDIGKLGVPEGVLNKEERLTDDEYGQVREHPRTGHGILSRILDDELVLAVTAWHHERWDGKGYPDGLAGEAIPLPARLVALADSLDAMTSPRAYRDGLEWDDAVGQIRARGGSQFDPGLLPVFEGVLPRLKDIRAAAQLPSRAGLATEPASKEIPSTSSDAAVASSGEAGEPPAGHHGGLVPPQHQPPEPEEIT